MAVMSDSDRAKAARALARRIYAGGSANCHHTDLLAAVGAIDDAFEGTAANLPGTAGQTIAVRLNQALPNPFGSNATLEQKAALLAVWAGVKYGIITNGGD